MELTFLTEHLRSKYFSQGAVLLMIPENDFMVRLAGQHQCPNCGIYITAENIRGCATCDSYIWCMDCDSKFGVAAIHPPDTCEFNQHLLRGLKDYLSTSKRFCVRCGKSAPPSSVCTSCREVRYCGDYCHQLDWVEIHEKECEKLAIRNKSD